MFSKALHVPLCTKILIIIQKIFGHYNRNMVFLVSHIVWKKLTMGPDFDLASYNFPSKCICVLFIILEQVVLMGVLAPLSEI